MLPTAVLYDPDLTDADKITYAVLANYAWTMGTASFEMTGEQLATLLGKHRNRAVAAVGRLGRTPHLRVESRRGLNRPNRYTLVHHKQGTRSTENSATGSTGNSAPGCTENGAPSIPIDRADERQSVALEAVDNCAHGTPDGHRRNAAGVVVCPFCRRQADPPF